MCEGACACVGGGGRGGVVCEADLGWRSVGITWHSRNLSILSPAFVADHFVAGLGLGLACMAALQTGNRMVVRSNPACALKQGTLSYLLHPGTGM